MTYSELLNLDIGRVRWLCGVPSGAVRGVLSQPSTADRVEVHCARLALHIARGAALPHEYAWTVLWERKPRLGPNVRLAPAEWHLRTMAMYAADLDSAEADPVPFLACEEFSFHQAAILRFARSPRALNDERLLDLSSNENPNVRHAVAATFDWRSNRYRNEILKRLMEDPVFRVRTCAAFVAGRTGDPELLDILDSEGLKVGSDPRGRPDVHIMANSQSSYDRGEAVWNAVLLKDREVLAKLWTDPEWDVRRSAILDSARGCLLEGLQLDEILAKESAEHLADLLLRWPVNDEETFARIAQVLRAFVSGFPASGALAAGATEVFEFARAQAGIFPSLSGAIIRLLPDDVAVQLAQELAGSPEPGGRAAAASAVAHRGLSRCFPLVAELCVDADKTVSEAAAHAVSIGRMRCGTYGLDTAILKAGNDARAAVVPRLRLGYLAAALLSGVG